MKTKPKPCKGIGNAKNYSGCGKISYKREYGLCPNCLREWSKTEEGFELYVKKRVIPRAKKKAEKERKQEEKQKKIENTNWKSKLQDSVNEIARIIDIGLPCLARGYHASQIHGGHVYSRGSNANIKLNLHNIHRQGAQSNHYQNDDGLLREGVIREYGQPYMDFISELRRTPTPKYSNLEYMEFTKKAREIARRLKREGLRYDLKERIEMRNKINKELGIYEDEYLTFEL